MPSFESSFGYNWRILNVLVSLYALVSQESFNFHKFSIMIWLTLSNQVWKLLLHFFMASSIVTVGLESHFLWLEWKFFCSKVQLDTSSHGLVWYCTSSKLIDVIVQWFTWECSVNLSWYETYTFDIYSLH